MGFNLKSLFPILAGAGASGIASQFSALSPFSAALGAGAGALTNKKSPLTGALQGFAGGGVGSALAGGLKNSFSDSTGGLLDKFGSGAMSGLQSFGGSIPGFGGIGTSNPTGALAKFFAPSQDSVLKNGTQFYKPNALGTGYDRTSAPMPISTPRSNFMPTASGTGGTTPTGSFGAMDMFKSLIPGAALAGVGSLLAPKVDAPDYSGVKNDLISRIQSGGNPQARQAAMDQYMGTLNAPSGASAEAGVANARLINERQKEAARKQIMDQFSANNGSTTGNSAYNDAITKSDSAYDQNYAANAGQLQFQYDTQQQAQKQAAANALAGMDDTQLQYYASLANLDVMQIQEKTGMDVASANAIKSIAATAGELLMQKSLGLGGAK